VARTSSSRATSRHRLQIELRSEHARSLDLLEDVLATRSRVDLIQEAIGVLLWYVRETMQGRKVVSVDPAEIDKLQHAVELASPSASLAHPNLYRFLIARPHPWRRQLSLKGRNMTVGQLVATMNADAMTPEQAADRLELPLEQVREALAYYEGNRDLIDAEFREEKRYLQERGYLIEPSSVSG
jgi:uncharacterized protein (DUF433 family)